MTSPESPFQADLAVDQQRYSLYERIYLVLAAAFVTLLVLTNIIGIKLFQAPLNPSFALTTGILTYPFTFLVTDIVSEIYGKRRADFMVIVGFAMSMLMLLVVQLAMRVPPHEAWVAGPSAYYQLADDQQHAFESVFALSGVLLFGSMTAYLCAQLTDNFLFHFWKRVTKGRHLWLRNNGSTMISQLVDTAVVNSILFFIGFGWDFAFGVKIMATIYVYKLVIALIDTPFIYLGVYVVKRMLGYEWHEEVS
ncbi:MAG: queuosine precursor transporter [Deltaproteobacteria bacterium]|nr:queuosine precursor transporter [Deltaproteobacteria bacterium]MBW2255438.1 queuosine precursor transporter [Deltaproteobacteria bacterium]